MKLLVGISEKLYTNKQTNKRMNKSESNHVPYVMHNIQCTCTYPISRKIFRISDRTFIRVEVTPGGGAPQSIEIVCLECLTLPRTTEENKQ